MDNYKEIFKRKDNENEASSSTTEHKNLNTQSHKFVIKQNVSGIKQGAKYVKRSVDSNDIVIPRRHGEGNKPLFEKDDVRVNRSKTPQKSYKSSSSSSSSSERYRQFDIRYIQRKNITSIGSSPEKSSTKKPSDKIPYFADEKREEERLERKKKIEFRSKQHHSRSEKKRVSGHRRSSSSYRKSPSRTRSNSRHRSYQDKRHRMSLTRLHRQSRSRTRSRSRDRYKSAPYIPPIYPVVIAAPSTSDYVYNPQNWLQQVVPIAPVPPPRYPFFMRPYGNPFPHLPTIPPFRYPMPTITSRHMYRATNHRQRNTRGKQLNRNFHRSRNP